MFESDVGLSTSFTRQCAGSGGRAAPPARPGPPAACGWRGSGRRAGATNGPDGIASAVTRPAAWTSTAATRTVVAGAAAEPTTAMKRDARTIMSRLRAGDVDVLNGPIEPVNAAEQVELRDEQIAVRVDGHAVRRQHEAGPPLRRRELVGADALLGVGADALDDLAGLVENA